MAKPSGSSCGEPNEILRTCIHNRRMPDGGKRSDHPALNGCEYRFLKSVLILSLLGKRKYARTCSHDEIIAATRSSSSAAPTR